ncbi:hypothetical protein J3R82DRAFT_1335, partial [Butyriboletus roseoflavus]
INHSKTFHLNNQMRLKDIADFRWTPGTNSKTISYIQAYTTDKEVSYQLHEGLFCLRKPSELLTNQLCQKFINDLDEQSSILFACTGHNLNLSETRPHEGCACLKVRFSLANANDIL